ncbi:hypothetical protein QFC19_002812 [Naganishia cerealis]|uniref:Uncharacterized protein n=1 Tax=Naganishia cerealis TaxID=610337 RepID=A0ACC2W692_9TREE|nr:hypothetical protein QFC19_002812 [Naganishia cerealis]
MSRDPDEIGLAPLLLVYAVAILIVALLVWFDVFYRSDVIRVGNRTELINARAGGEVEGPKPARLLRLFLTLRGGYHQQHVLRPFHPPRVQGALPEIRKRRVEELGLMPKRYRLDADSMAVIMDEYAGQIAKRYGQDVAKEALYRSASDLHLKEKGRAYSFTYPPSIATSDGGGGMHDPALSAVNTLPLR